MNEQRCPLARLVLEQALEPELVRVQALALQEQALLQVAELARLELQVQVQLELLTQEQVQLKPLV